MLQALREAEHQRAFMPSFMLSFFGNSGAKLRAGFVPESCVRANAPGTPIIPDGLPPTPPPTASGVPHNLKLSSLSVCNLGEW